MGSRVSPAPACIRRDIRCGLSIILCLAPFRMSAVSTFMMKEDEITEYLQQFSMEQLEQIKLLVETTAKKKKAQREKPMRSTVGLPPTPPKDVAEKQKENNNNKKKDDKNKKKSQKHKNRIK